MWRLVTSIMMAIHIQSQVLLATFCLCFVVKVAEIATLLIYQTRFYFDRSVALTSQFACLNRSENILKLLKDHNLVFR